MYLPGTRSSAGFPSPADDYIDKTLDLNELLIKNRAATFFMRVDGDCLKASGISNQDLLIVDRSVSAAHGKIVVAVVDGELVVRRLEKQGDDLVLTADVETSDRPKADGEAIQIWGVVTHVVHHL